MSDGKTQLLGVIGSPISHSLSPVMHNAAIAALGLNWVYLPLEIPITDLAIAYQGLKSIQNLQGFNLTIPHKQQIIPHLDQITPIAQAIGAVNTVKRTAQGWIGTNTDAAGFLVPLQQLQQDWHNSTVLILGNGGAAKAVVAACLQLNFAQIALIGRNPDRLVQFSDQINHPRLTVHSWSELDALLPATSLLVNTTPIGMAEDACPLSLDQIYLLDAQAIVYDLIYTPRPTLLLQQAQARRLTTIDGLAMLLHQGALALEFWLECPAPLPVMTKALTAYLGS
ncbi:MAG: shikimate dehydrogenase [Pseudanabaenaceae cyanobacterium bins.68]|nr:shikimate dehydrogenase [Pseudanabaenaceae cyanobacterium bins.68]